jgi:hypothetical protein
MFEFSSKEAVDSFWESVVLERFPQAKMKFKDESKLMKLIGFLMFFNRRFMTDYITTVGFTIYFPSRKWVENNYGSTLWVMTHEFIHLWDRNECIKENKVDTFAIGYLSPQLFSLISIFAFLAFFNSWFLLFLIFLGFMLPWPSKWRTTWELNGYGMTMLFYGFIQRTQYNALEHATVLADEFTTAQYYWMCRDKNYIIQQLTHRYETMLETHGGAAAAYQWLKTHQL